jgi:hypothetical protein
MTQSFFVEAHLHHEPAQEAADEGCRECRGAKARRLERAAEGIAQFALNVDRAPDLLRRGVSMNLALNCVDCLFPCD